MSNPPADIENLDAAMIGNVLISACLVSWHLAHASVAGTVRDYLAPHRPYPNAETEFVYRVLTGEDPRNIMSEELAALMLRTAPLPWTA